MKFKFFLAGLMINLFFGFLSFENVFAMDKRIDEIKNVVEENEEQNVLLRRKREKEKDSLKMEKNKKLCFNEEKIGINNENVFAMDKRIDGIKNVIEEEEKIDINNENVFAMDKRIDEIKNVIEENEEQNVLIKEKDKELSFGEKNNNMIKKFRCYFDFGGFKLTQSELEEKVITFLYFVAATNFLLNMNEESVKDNVEKRTDYIFDNEHLIFDEWYTLDFLKIKVADFGFLHGISTEKPLVAYIEFSYMYDAFYDELLKRDISKLEKNIARYSKRGVEKFNEIFKGGCVGSSLSYMERKIFSDVKRKVHSQCFVSPSIYGNGKKGYLYKDFMFSILFCDPECFYPQDANNLLTCGIDFAYSEDKMNEFYMRLFYEHCTSDVMKKVVSFFSVFKKYDKFYFKSELERKENRTLDGCIIANIKEPWKFYKIDKDRRKVKILKRRKKNFDDIYFRIFVSYCKYIETCC